MVDKTIPELETETNTTLPDNISGQITPATLRALIMDILENEHLTATQIATTSGTPSSSTVLYGDNTWKEPAGGGGTFTGSGDPGLSRAGAIATTFSSPPPTIRTTGYYDAGDGGGGLYVKVTTAPTDHPAYFTSGDGAHYELRAENGQVNLLQFGAKPMVDYNTMPTIDGDHDSYAAFVAADRFISYVYSGGIKLVVPSTARSGGATFFMGHTHSLYRSNYLIEGEGFTTTFIRTPPYQSGFMVGSTFGPLDYNFSDPNNTYAAGFATIKRPEQAGPYNCYRCIVGGAVGPTDGLSGTDPAATYTWGASQWKFERYVGPGSVWDYSATPNGTMNMIIRQLSFWSFWLGRTLPDFSGGFGGSTDTALNKWPSQDLDVSGRPRYQCGIGLRNRSTLDHVQTLQYNAFGVACAANGDPELFNWTGNVDGTHINHLYSYYNGKSGLHDRGNNANASNYFYVDTAKNGRIGAELFNFLGNNLYGHQSAGDGVVFAATKQYLSGATYNGYVWYPRLPIIGVESTPAYINEEPNPSTNHAWTKWFGDGTATYGVKGTITGSISGTTLTVTASSITLAAGDMLSSAGGEVRPGTRIQSGSGSTFTLAGASQTVSSRTITVMDGSFYYSDQFEPWDASIQYEPGGPFGSCNNNARNNFNGMYQEGGVNPGQPGPKDLVEGGMTQTVDISRGAEVRDAAGLRYNARFQAVRHEDGIRHFSRSAVPTVAGDALAPFAAGDVCNIRGAGSGAVHSYQCTTAGDPGVWKARGTLA